MKRKAKDQTALPGNKNNVRIDFEMTVLNHVVIKYMGYQLTV